MEKVTNFTFLGSKITADCDCSHEIKRHLLLGSKAMTNLDSVLKSTDIALPAKVCIQQTSICYTNENAVKPLDYANSDIILLVMLMSSVPASSWSFHFAQNNVTSHFRWLNCVCVCVCEKEGFISSLLLKFYVYYSAQNLARQVFPFYIWQNGSVK